MDVAVYVDWYEEKLNEYYKNDRPNNEGLIHGIYFYDKNNEERIETKWFKTEEKRNRFFKTVKNTKLIN